MRPCQRVSVQPTNECLIRPRNLDARAEAGSGAYMGNHGESMRTQVDGEAARMHKGGNPKENSQVLKTKRTSNDDQNKRFERESTSTQDESGEVARFEKKSIGGAATVIKK